MTIPMTIAGWTRKLGLLRSGAAEPRRDETSLNWRTLQRYARAAKEFVSSGPQTLPASTFARLASSDHRVLPEPQLFALSDGGQMAFRRYAVATARRMAVVLLHGSAGHAGQLHSLAGAIADRGLGVVYTMDLRGHGASPGRRGHAVGGADRLCADICEFLQFLRRTGPPAPIVLGGHSAGGGVVLRICRNPPGGRLSGCLFLAPYLGLGSATIRPCFGGWVTVRYHQLRVVALANALGIRWLNDVTVADFDLAPLAHDPDYVPSWSFNTMLAFGPGLWPDRPQPIPADIPVLSVSGDRDECFYPEAYPAALAAVAPHAQVSSIADCGHWDILVDPRVIARVAAWLEGLLDNRREALAGGRLTA